MCPSETHIIEVGQAQAFGPATLVFRRETHCPCSINVKDNDDNLIIQVRREGSEWFDYEPGQMIIGRDIECRLATACSPPCSIEVEVFYN